jgi:RpiR family carbohydrate utilization transcriptional regulator
MAPDQRQSDRNRIAMKNLLEATRKALDSFSNSERKVAEAVLADPEAVINSSMAVLAQAAGVSEPTVLRFCRAIGYEGFTEFKVRLAQSLVTRGVYADLEVKPGDPAEAYSQKIVDATIDMLIQLRHRLDAAAIEAATELLSRAHKIEFYGMGASGVVAIDAQHKFFRLKIPCVAYADSHMQYMSAATLGPEDVVVAISHTGRNRELLASVALAKQSGAAVIAITSPRSPLAEMSSLALTVSIPEDTDVYTPMFSRLMHLVVIDILAVGLALRGGESTRLRLRRIKQALYAKRTPKEL